MFLTQSMCSISVSYCITIIVADIITEKASVPVSNKSLPKIDFSKEDQEKNKK